MIVIKLGGRPSWNKGLKGVQTAWNKGLTKETDERVKKYGEMGKGKHKLLGEKNSMFGKHWSQETRIKNSREKSPHWKGGVDFGNQHELARRMFGIDYCEECGITLEEYNKDGKKYKQFDMHCITKDPKILEKWNWKTLCHKDHGWYHKVINETAY